MDWKVMVLMHLPFLLKGSKPLRHAKLRHPSTRVRTQSRQGITSYLKTCQDIRLLFFGIKLRHTLYPENISPSEKSEMLCVLTLYHFTVYCQTDSMWKFAATHRQNCKSYIKLLQIYRIPLKIRYKIWETYNFIIYPRCRWSVIQM
jgi:hypothetical protein